MIQPTANDSRIVCGASCTWWSAIANAAIDIRNGLPCCPHCRGVLLEFDSIKHWQRAVHAYAREIKDPSYPTMVAWLHGRCYSTTEIARVAWLESTLPSAS